MSDFDIHDTVLDQITYGELVLMAKNINPKSGKRLREEFYNLLMDRVEDAMKLFDQNAAELFDEAFPDDNISSEEIEELANQIYKLLLKYDMWIDVHIYYNGKCMTTSIEDEDGYKFRYNEEPPFIEEDVDPRRYFDYVGPYLSMSFEGPLYHMINYGSYEDVSDNFLTEFNDLFDEYCLYYELGDAWNLSAYKI